MPENYNIINNVDADGANAVSFTKLYIRHVPSKVKSNKAIILLNSRSLCVESSMGIDMGTISFADYLARNGIHAFLFDMRGFGMSSVVEEQLSDSYDNISKQLSVYDYYSDITCAVNFIKKRISNPELSIFGFSFAGALVVGYCNKYPDVFKNIVVLNSTWKRYEDDVYGFDIQKASNINDSLPYFEITMDTIQNRLLQAQPAGKNFIEPLWYEQAKAQLMRYHTTYNKDTHIWKIAKMTMGNMFFENTGILKNVTQRVLLLTSQYDVENPIFTASRLYKDLYCAKRYLITVPNATHLCIWEKQRHYVYQRTMEFLK